MLKRFYENIILTDRLLIALMLDAALCIAGFFWEPLFVIGKLGLLVLLGLLTVDLMFLFAKRNGLVGHRNLPEKFSNGDENSVYTNFKNNYFFPIQVKVIEEFPFQFEYRNTSFDFKLKPGDEEEYVYNLRPTERGEYHFGSMNSYVMTFIGFASKRYAFCSGQMVPVYPSFLQLKKYEFLAISDRLTTVGIKKIRKIGQNMEFDQIREYVRGDDFRNINWKATARKSSLMVNQYQDERSQNVYCIVDKGRAMKMPFDNLSLMDYAINATLVMSSIALNKDDRAGLITFSNRIGTIIKASKKKTQMNAVLEALYNQETRFQESDFGRLYKNITWNITSRSMLLLFTNFESLVALQRQIKYLRAIARNHLLVVVFFENSELKEIREERAKKTEEIYIKTIAEKFAYEKRLIVKELQKYGIHSILTTPENLTVNSINKYLELKARGLI